MRDAKGRFIKGHAVLPGRDESGKFQKTSAPYRINEFIWDKGRLPTFEESQILDPDYPGQIIPYKRPSLWQRIKAHTGKLRWWL